MVLDGSWNEIIVFQGEENNDYFGYSVSLSSDNTRVAIGAPHNDNNDVVLDASDAGQVKVYDYNTGDIIGNPIEGKEYDIRSGTSVSLSSDGTIVAIGAIRALKGEDGAVDRPMTGHVRVYQYIDEDWKQIGEDIDGEAKDDNFGKSVSLSSDGKTVAIGAPNHNSRGQVKVYENKGNGVWDQIGKIGGQEPDENLGYSLSLSSDGTRVAIGCKGDHSSKGQVRVYEYKGNNVWHQIGKIGGTFSREQSGWSVSLSSDGTTVAIGAPHNIMNDPEEHRTGHVRVYEYKGNNVWHQIGNIQGDTQGDKSGWSVSLSSDGTILAIGAPYNEDGNPPVDTWVRRGHVKVYQYKGNDVWDQIGEDIDGETDTAFSGYSVSLSSEGRTVAIGASFSDNFKGSVRVYELSDNQAGDSAGGDADAGDTVGGGSDPYVTTLSGITYKMADFTGFSRMLQGTLENKPFTINTETTLLNKEELTELAIQRNKLFSEEIIEGYKVDEFPAYFSKLHASWGEKSVTVDLKTFEVIHSTTNEEYETKSSMGKQYAWSTKETKEEKMFIPFGPVTLVVKNIPNVDVRNGFTIMGSKHITDKVGALVKPMYVKDIKLKSLTSTKLIKDVQERKPKKTIKQVFRTKGGEMIEKDMPIY